MLSNERFALDCIARYEAQGLVVDARNGEFAHCPLTRHECDTGYYLLHEDHQHQGLLQSKDLGKCCFYAHHTLKWLKECDCFSENYFELWDIYDKYSGDNVRRVMEKLHKEKDENGKSLHAVKAGKKGGEKANEAKDEDGKSLAAVKGGTKTSAQIWESTVDRFRSNAGAVAQHNRANGWDPNARIRIA